MNKKKERFVDIDCAKGLTIILVVLGHITARDYPLGNEWFIYLRKAIYTFHMPLFMFLSGWLFYYSLPSLVNLEDKVSYLTKKAYRLLVPFFLFGTIVILGKYFAGMFLFVDNPVNNLLAGFSSIIWNTKDSCVYFIWFIYVLFIYNVLTLFLIKVSNTKLWIITILALILRFVKPPEYLYLNLITYFYIFFILGCVAFANKDKYYRFIDKNKYYLLMFYLVLLFIFLCFLPFNSFKLIVGVIAIPAIHGLIKSKLINSSKLLTISTYTFSIYLFNVIFIGFSKAILMKFMNWNGLYFFIFLPVMISSGIFLPIICKKYIFNKIPHLDKLTT